MPPDGWLAVQLTVSLFMLAACALEAGVILEQCDQKEIADSGVGVSVKALGALLLCLPLCVWGAYCTGKLAKSVSSADAISTARLPQLFSALIYVGFFVFFFSVAAVVFFLFFAWGRVHSEQYADKLKVFAPFVAAMTCVARLVTSPARGALRARGVGDELGSVTEEDVLELVDTVEENDLIDQNQREMINNIFELRDVTASEIMTHRTELESVPITASVDDIIDVATEFGYSRIPVYEDSLDDIVGIACVKDLLPYVGKKTTGVQLKSLLRKTIFVPESCRARELLFEFQQKKVQLAVVVDEYGGTAGIVTMEDILESIVGDIEDEYDEEEKLIVKNKDGSLTCDGYAEVEDVYEALGLGEPPEDIESETIGGMLTDLLARIPAFGEHPSARCGNLELKALDVDERRITCVLASRTDKPLNTEEE